MTEMSAKRVEKIYDSRRKWTDVAQNVAALGSLGRFRRMAVKAAGIRKGDTVLDLACGAGGNIEYIREAVGPEGIVVGSDLSEGMLKVAREMVQSRGWKNVLLVREDSIHPAYQQKFDAIVSTYSMSIVPEHIKVIEATSSRLKPGGRMVIFDRHLKEGGWFRSMFNKVIGIGGPKWHANWHRKPWEDLRPYLENVEMREVFMGLYYIAWGNKKS